jgi:hypothetical protein
VQMVLVVLKVVVVMVVAEVVVVEVAVVAMVVVRLWWRRSHYCCCDCCCWCCWCRNCCGRRPYRALFFLKGSDRFPSRRAATQLPRRLQGAHSARTSLQESATFAPHRNRIATWGKSSFSDEFQHVHGHRLQDLEQRLALCKLGAVYFCEVSHTAQLHRPKS